MKFLQQNPRLIRTLSVVLLLVVGLSFSVMTDAKVDLTGTLEKAGDGIYGESEKPNKDTMVVIIGKVIRIVLSFVGVILVMIIVYAGFLWMTAGGNEDQVKKAKAWLTNAIVGLVVALSAYAISAFVVSNLGGAVLEATPSSD